MVMQSVRQRESALRRDYLIDHQDSLTMPSGVPYTKRRVVFSIQYPVPGPIEWTGYGHDKLSDLSPSFLFQEQYIARRPKVRWPRQGYIRNN